MIDIGDTRRIRMFVKLLDLYHARSEFFLNDILCSYQAQSRPVETVTHQRVSRGFKSSSIMEKTYDFS